MTHGRVTAQQMGDKGFADVGDDSRGQRSRSYSRRPKIYLLLLHKTKLRRDCVKLNYRVSAFANRVYFMVGLLEVFHYLPVTCLN